MAYPNTTSQSLHTLKINKVPDEATFEQMQEDNLVNANELYLVEGDNTATLNVESPITYVNNTIGFDGYDVTTTTTTLCNETVTTNSDGNPWGYANLAYSTPIDSDPIKVTFNGVEYICPKLDRNGAYCYGATTSDSADFSEYPFGLTSSSDNNGNILITKNAGTYTIKIETITDNITVSSDFAKARGYSIVENPSQVLVNESATTTSSGTYNEGTLSYFSNSNDAIKVTFNNVEYICPRNNNNSYGAQFDSSSDDFDFSTYPFNLYPDSSNNSTQIVTQTAGTYTVKIENFPTVAVLTNDFKQAVKSSFPGDVMIKGQDYVTAGQKPNSDLGYFATAEGYYTTASALASHAEGYYTTASADHSHAEGYNTIASSQSSHAEGNSTTASALASHAEGQETTASGTYSHAEGAGTTASGQYSHAEGNLTTASQKYSHSEGYSTQATGAGSHAEGNSTTASGQFSHTEGIYVTASGYYSHAEGQYTTANHKSQHVFGEYNVLDTSTASVSNRGNYVEIVGKGTSASARSNARTLDWNGNEVLAGKLTVGTGPTANMDVATKQYVDNATSNTGTITGVSVNGTSVATSGVANITSIPASILSGAIPSAVTATTQANSDNSTKIATTAFVKTAISGLIGPMMFKGTLGTGGTITTLPTAAEANTGFTYKVITDGTYASIAAKVGDLFISNGSTWVIVPSGDETFVPTLTSTSDGQGHVTLGVTVGPMVNGNTMNF